MTPSSTKKRPKPDRREISTSLEIPLVREGDTLRIDLTNLPIFFGLSILARGVGEKVITCYYLDRVDVAAEKKVKHSETPELAEMQVENVKVRGDYAVLDRILEDREAFHEDLKTVFGSLQMQRWRSHVYPDDPEAESCCLVFPRTRMLDSGPYRFRILLEMLRSSKKADKFFLRLLFEGMDRRHLDLKSLPHVVVENPEGRTFIAGATRLSQMLYEQVRWAARRGKRTHSEIHQTDSFIFSRLHEAGLNSIVALEIAWTEGYVERLRSMNSEQLMGVFKKILLLLEDHTVRGLLQAGSTLRVDCGDLFVQIDLSQLGRVLNLSFGHRRKVFGIQQYLYDRMPVLSGVTDEHRTASSLKGVNVFLIHHVTAEILGFIAALRELGARDVFTLFVHYGEEVPSDFLEALLALDQEHYRFYSLNNVVEPLSVEGYFLLSPRFSLLHRMKALNEKFLRERPGYFEAMVRTATRLFLEVLLRTVREGTKCIMVEDGGYLAPVLAEWVHDRVRFADLLRENELAVPEEMEQMVDLPMGEVLDRWLLGTVEHTKNGLERLAETCEKKGALARPAFSIAVSTFKVTEEAGEVAATILSAVESVLHAQGKVLSRRKALVIGAEGCIGRHLVEQLRVRCLSPDRFSCLGVDIRKPDRPGEELPYAWAPRIRELPGDLLRKVDLILGVTGKSAMLWEDMEAFLLQEAPSTFYLVSGSTKTIEFQSVSQGLEDLLKMRSPAVQGVPCRIEGEEVCDPQTRRLLGHKYRVVFDPHPANGGEGNVREIWFLGNLMPINFLYYGVPAEVIDVVLAQLLRSSLGLARRVCAGEELQKKPYAVDQEIDLDGEPISG
jgi:hypothetical protein